MHRPELLDAELARDPPDMEVYILGGWEVDLDGVDVQPNQEPADLDSLEVLDAAVPDDAGDLGLVVDEILEVDVARAVDIDREAPVGTQGEGLDRVWEEARGEAILGEEIVDGGAVGSRGEVFGSGEGEKEKIGEEEEEEEVRRRRGRREDRHGVLENESGRDLGEEGSRFAA